MDVLLIDDHPLFRKALGMVLAQLADEIRLRETTTVTEALDTLDGDKIVDLVLYDWFLPDGGGVRGLISICQLLPTVPVVVISANEDPGTINTALTMGARGYIPKSASTEVIGSALQLVLQGEIYVPSATLRHGRNSLPLPMPTWGDLLTARQEQVLSLLAEGHANKRIAQMLGIAEATVRVHVSGILRELQVDNRTEAVVRARRLGLLHASPVSCD
jgi:DNA-binding NarL/FixJ family response regulator